MLIESEDFLRVLGALGSYGSRFDNPSRSNLRLYRMSITWVTRSIKVRIVLGYCSWILYNHDCECTSLEFSYLSYFIYVIYLQLLLVVYLLSKVFIFKFPKSFCFPNSRRILVEGRQFVIVFPVIDIRYWPLAILCILFIIAGLFSANKKCINN